MTSVSVLLLLVVSSIFFIQILMTQKRESIWVYGAPMESNAKVKCVFCDMTYNGLSIFVQYVTSTEFLVIYLCIFNMFYFCTK